MVELNRKWLDTYFLILCNFVLQYFKGRECIIREKTYTHFYNLNPLYNKTHNYIAASPTNEKYYINICGPVIGNCGSYDSEVSVCWHNKALGHFNMEPTYYNGEIEQKMTGEACRRNGPNSTVMIKFLCEMDVHAEDHNKIQLKHKVSCPKVIILFTYLQGRYKYMDMFAGLCTDRRLVVELLVFYIYYNDKKWREWMSGSKMLMCCNAEISNKHVQTSLPQLSFSGLRCSFMWALVLVGKRVGF